MPEYTGYVGYVKQKKCCLSRDKKLVLVAADTSCPPRKGRRSDCRARHAEGPGRDAAAARALLMRVFREAVPEEWDW